MIRTHKFVLFALLVTLLVLLSAGWASAAVIQNDYPSGSTVSPWIQSDQADYAPASTVTLTSAGWQPG